MNKRYHLLVCTAVFSLFLFTGRLPLPAEDTELEIEEIVVTATRVETALLDAPTHITIITGEDIARQGATNFADILSLKAGITINDYGPEGSLKSVSIRGSDSSGVLILVDGIRMNDSRQSGVDLSLIPIDMIDRVEIIRGGTSALYGADAVGGVVNIITRKKAENSLRLSVENGSYIPRKAVKVSEGAVEEKADASLLDLVDTQKVVVGYSRDVGKASVVASGSFTRAKNEFVWNDDEYTGDYRKRINADMMGTDLYASLLLPAFGGQFDITGMFGYSRRGVPGKIDPTDFSLSTDARQKNILTNGSIHYSTDRFLSDFLTFDATAYHRFSVLGYEDPDDFFPVDSMHKTHSAGIDAHQELLSFDIFTLIYGANLHLDFVDSTDIGTKERVSGGLFLEVPLYALTRFTIIPSLRYDLYSDFPDTFDYKLDGIYSLSENASLKAGFAKSYRAPSLNDLYWPADPWTEGNPDLKPETGYSGEVGLSMRRKRLSCDVFTFTRYMQDEIEWTEGPDFIWRPYNIGETFYLGAEAAGSIEVLKGLWIDLNYTLTYSFVLKGASGTYSISDDKRVPYVPVHSLNGWIRYTPGKNSIGLSAQLESKRYTNETNTNSVDSTAVFNARYTRTLSEALLLKIAVDNIFNATYETVEGYIMPPLFIRAGIEARF